MKKRADLSSLKIKFRENLTNCQRATRYWTSASWAPSMCRRGRPNRSQWTKTKSVSWSSVACHLASKACRLRHFCLLYAAQVKALSALFTYHLCQMQTCPSLMFSVITNRSGWAIIDRHSSGWNQSTESTRWKKWTNSNSGHWSNWTSRQTQWLHVYRISLS